MGSDARVRAPVPHSLIRAMGKHASAVQGRVPPVVWTISSQAWNSLGNFVLAILVARTSTPTEYGAWSISYLGYVVTVGIARAVSAQPLLLHKGGRAPKDVVSGALAVALLVGLGGAAVLGGVGWVVPDLRASAWSIAAFLPALSCVDTARSAFFQQRRSFGAATVDSVWLFCQLGLFVALIWLAADTVTSLTLVWGAAATVATVIGWLMLGTFPTARAGRGYLRSSADVGWKLLVDQTLMTARTHLTPVVVAAVAGLAAAGSLRAGLTLMGALGTLVLAIVPIATIAGVRAWERGSSPWPLLRKWSAIILAASAANGAFFLLLPDMYGEVLLGENWKGAGTVLLPLVLHSLLRGPLVTVPTLLKASGALNRVLWLRFRIEAISLVLPLAGALMGGAVGAAWGMALAAAFANVQCVRALRYETRGSWSRDPEIRGVKA